MPIYDWMCKKCGKETAKVISYAEYENLTTTPCVGCGEDLTRDDRVMGKGLKTKIVGVSKGNYNSNDWS